MSSKQQSSFEKMEARAAQAEQKRATKAPEIPDDVDTEQLELPIELLGPGARGAPDTMLRSALFTATKPGKRKMLENALIASVSNITMRQTGYQLQQTDLDVYLELIRLAAETRCAVVKVPAKTLLRRIGRSAGKRAKTAMLESLDRLQIANVTIESDTQVYSGSLIFESKRDKDTLEIVARLNPRVAELFDGNSWSQLQLDERHQLKRYPLAQWLHGYYSSHTRAHPIKVATLRDLCGSKASNLYHFRADLLAAMERVSEVTGWNWRLGEGDKLVVEKSFSLAASC